MGIYCTLLIFPEGGDPPKAGACAETTIAVVQALERAGMLVQGTGAAGGVGPPDPEEVAGLGGEEDIGPVEGATMEIDTAAILQPLRELLPCFPEETDPDDFFCTEPFISVTVLSKRVKLMDLVTGHELGNTWAWIAANYGDRRYDPKIHRVRTLRLPVVKELERVFGGSLTWGAHCG